MGSFRRGIAMELDQLDSLMGVLSELYFAVRSSMIGDKKTCAAITVLLMILPIVNSRHAASHPSASANGTGSSDYQACSRQQRMLLIQIVLAGKAHTSHCIKWSMNPPVPCSKSIVAYCLAPINYIKMGVLPGGVESEWLLCIQKVIYPGTL